MFITGRTRKLQSPYMFSGVLTSYFTDLTGGGGGGEIQFYTSP